MFSQACYVLKTTISSLVFPLYVHFVRSPSNPATISLKHFIVLRAFEGYKSVNNIHKGYKFKAGNYIFWFWLMSHALNFLHHPQKRCQICVSRLNTVNSQCNMKHLQLVFLCILNKLFYPGMSTVHDVNIKQF